MSKLDKGSTIRFNKGDMITIYGDCKITGDLNTWECTSYEIDGYIDDDNKYIDIRCHSLESAFAVEDKIYNKLCNNPNYINGNITVELENGIIFIVISDASTDNVKIDENLNISVTKRRRRRDNNSANKKQRTRIKVGVKFTMLLDSDEIESYEKDIKPVIDDFLKKIRPTCTNGIKLTDKVCWQLDKDPDFDKSELDFTL